MKKYMSPLSEIIFFTSGEDILNTSQIGESGLTGGGTYAGFGENDPNSVWNWDS